MSRKEEAVYVLTPEGRAAGERLRKVVGEKLWNDKKINWLAKGLVVLLLDEGFPQRFAVSLSNFVKCLRTSKKSILFALENAKENGYLKYFLKKHKMKTWAFIEIFRDGGAELLDDEEWASRINIDKMLSEE